MSLNTNYNIIGISILRIIFISIALFFILQKTQKDKKTRKKTAITEVNVAGAYDDGGGGGGGDTSECLLDKESIDEWIKEHYRNPLKDARVKFYDKYLSIEKPGKKHHDRTKKNIDRDIKKLEKTRGRFNAEVAQARESLKHAIEHNQYDPARWRYYKQAQRANQLRHYANRVVQMLKQQKRRITAGRTGAVFNQDGGGGEDTPLPE